MPVLWTSGVDGSVSSLSPGRLEKFERSLKVASQFAVQLKVWTGVSPTRFVLARVHGSGARGRVRLEESLKSMIISIHVVMNDRESALMLVIVRPHWLQQKKMFKWKETVEQLLSYSGVDWTN